MGNGTGVVQANPDVITGSFANKGMSNLKVNLSITGGQAKINGVYSSRVYGGSGGDIFHSVYAAEHTSSEGQVSYDALLVKFSTDLPTGSVNNNSGVVRHDRFKLSPAATLHWAIAL